jgi:hypothetical protein
MLIDTEVIVKETFAFIKSKLNAELLLIDTEKADFVLDPIYDNAWAFQNLNAEVFSYPSFVVYGLQASPTLTDSNIANSIKNCLMFFEVVLTDDGSKISENIFYKLLRYSRALESIIHKNPNRILSGIKFQVEELLPTSFEINGATYRSAGINISARYSSR